jgi:hypothetical protein
MPVTVKVNGTVNSLVHKGSNGISAATIPDVCKTPSPGGPVPIPYPNISQSATLDKGTTTVKADGGMTIATKGSEFSLSNGDNAGVAGGVKSSTFMKESTWILYSFDVKMDGQNACRLTDKKFQNHENTADLGGVIQQIVAQAIADLEDLVCECDKKVNAKTDRSKETCRSLGDAKHECCNEAIKKHENRHLGPEKGYRKDGSAATPPRKKSPTESWHEYYTRIGGTMWPDASVRVGGKPVQLVEFKFSCPGPDENGVGVGVRKPGEAPFAVGGNDTSWTPGKGKKPGQPEKYEKLSETLGIDVDENPPRLINNSAC